MLVRIKRHRPELPPWLLRLEATDAPAAAESPTPDAQLQTWAAEYDALGRRLLTRWSTRNGAEKTRRFYWDGDRLAAELFPDGQLRIYEYATTYQVSATPVERTRTAAAHRSRAALVFELRRGSGSRSMRAAPRTWALDGGPQRAEVASLSRYRASAGPCLRTVARAA
jgi:hypothetical protein